MATVLYSMTLHTVLFCIVLYKTFTFTSIFLQYSACHQFTMLSSKTVQVII